MVLLDYLDVGEHSVFDFAVLSMGPLLTVTIITYYAGSQPAAGGDKYTSASDAALSKHPGRSGPARPAPHCQSALMEHTVRITVQVDSLGLTGPTLSTARGNA